MSAGRPRDVDWQDHHRIGHGFPSFRPSDKGTGCHWSAEDASLERTAIRMSCVCRIQSKLNDGLAASHASPCVTPFPDTTLLLHLRIRCKVSWRVWRALEEHHSGQLALIHPNLSKDISRSDSHVFGGILKYIELVGTCWNHTHQV